MDKPTTLGADWREIGLVAIALVAFTALTLFLTDGVVLFTRPLWLDEWLTVLIARRPTPAHIIGDLAAGADGGSGLFHLGVWTLRAVAGDLTPQLLRAASLVMVLAGLGLTFATLRSRFSFAAALAGALAVGANSAAVTYSYEARFYAPWFMLAAAHAWTLSRSQQSPSRGRRVAQGVAAVLLALIHFYGIVALVLMIVGALASRGREWRGALKQVAPSFAGFVATASLVPLALSMRRAFSVKTWVPDFSLAQLWDLALVYWVTGVTVLALIGLLFVTVVDRLSAAPTRGTTTRAALGDAGIASLAALALMPLAFTVASLLGQPTMIARYSIVAALAWAPLVALALERWGTRVARGAVLALVWFWFSAYTREVWTQLVRAEEVAGIRAGLARGIGDGLPLATPSMHVLYPMLSEPATLGALAYLTPSDSIWAARFPAGSPDEWRGRIMLSERDLARVHNARFGFPRIVTRDDLARFPKFLLLAPTRPLNPAFRNMEQFVAATFPAHRLTMLSPELGLLERVSPVTISRTSP